MQEQLAIAASQPSTSELWMFSGQMIFNALIALGMFMLKRKTDETDSLRASIESRDAEIRAAAEQIVTDRMGVMMQAIERIEQRLADGDKRFRDLNKHDHQADLQLVKKVAELHTYVTQHCATAEQQREFRKELTTISIAVGHLQQEAP